MSRIGKKPVAMPSGVSASVEGQTLTPALSRERERGKVGREELKSWRN